MHMVLKYSTVSPHQNILFPTYYMMPVHLRELRQILRYRNLPVREATRLKIKQQDC